MPDVLDASKVVRMIAEMRRQAEPATLLDKWDALGEAVKVLMDAVPPPHPWRLIRRWRLEAKRKYALECIHYMWPDWFTLAVECGCDPAELTSVALLTIGYAPEPMRMRHPMY